MGFSGRPRYLTSPTTPTIDNHGAAEAGGPNFTRRPIASCSGQKRLTTRSLTTMAVDALVISASTNVRPPTIGIRSVAKNSGETRCTYARGMFCAVTGG